MHAESELTFPHQFNFGVAYKGIRRFVFEADLHFEDWSSFREQKIMLSEPSTSAASVVTQKNWKDTYAIGLGADFRVNDHVSLLSGYLYSGNPIPDETLNRLSPIQISMSLIWEPSCAIKRSQSEFPMAISCRKKEGKIILLTTILLMVLSIPVRVQTGNTTHTCMLWA